MLSVEISEKDLPVGPARSPPRHKHKITPQKEPNTSMVKTMTVPHVVADGCRRPKFLHDGAHPLCRILHLMVDTDRYRLLLREDWSRLAACSAPFFDCLAYQRFWVEYLGFTIHGTIPEGFCTMKLFVVLRAQRNDAQTEWARPLMTECVEERKLGDELTQLIIPYIGDSQYYWMERLEQLLTTPSFPTEPQVAEVRALLEVLVQKDRMGSVVPVLRMMCAQQKTMNRALQSVVLAFAIERARGDAPLEDRTKLAQALLSLLHQPRTIIEALVVYNDHSVVQIKARSDWHLKKPIPMLVRRLVLRALAAMSWRNLLTVVKGPHVGVWKAISRTIHLRTMLKKALRTALKKALRQKGGRSREDREEEEEARRQLQKVGLVVALLHKDKYPTIAGDEPQEAWATWCTWVAEPLGRLLRDPLFELAVADDKEVGPWLSRTPVAALAGRTVPTIVMRTLETELSRFGNNRATWQRLLTAGHLTLPQLLANARAIFRLGMAPADLVEQIRRRLLEDAEKQRLVASGSGRVQQQWVPVLKSIVALRGVLESSERERLGNKVRQHLREQQATTTRNRSNGPEPHVGRDASEPRIEEQSIVRDKNGATHAIKTHKRVAALFADPNAAGKHARAWETELPTALDAAVAAQVELQSGMRAAAREAAAAANAPPQEELAAEEEEEEDAKARRARTLALLVYTPEMGDLVRVGQPPEVPLYSPVALWRGESVCLQRLLGHCVPPAVGDDDGAARDQAHAARDTGRPGRPRPEMGGEEAGEEENPFAPPASTPPPPPPSSSRCSPPWTVLAGISWCQQEDEYSSVDLDLSLLLFDDNFRFLAHCSYEQLTLPGATHSGDLISAPYPHGSRETVEIDLLALGQAYPSCRYCALAVLSYSGQSFNDMHDASVFVANPNASGNGPGGIDILTAAKLTGGTGTINVAAYIEIEPVEAARGDAPLPEDRWMQGDRYHFVNCDQTLNVRCTGASATSQCQPIADAVRRVASLGSRPLTAAAAEHDEPAGRTPLRLRDAASLMAAAAADRVVVLHEVPGGSGDGKKRRGRTLFARREGETVAQLMRRMDTFLTDATACLPALDPQPTRLDASAWKWEVREEAAKSARLLVFGGELEDWLAIEREFDGQRWVGELAMVDMRSHENTAHREGNRTTMVNGWEALQDVL